MRERVRAILADVESGGEEAARKYAEELDGWTGDIVVSKEAIENAADKVPQDAKDDIAFALKQVRRFAEEQKARLCDFESEIYPGLIAGQKQIPVGAAGCYVPGGRFCAHCFGGDECCDCESWRACRLLLRVRRRKPHTAECIRKFYTR